VTGPLRLETLNHGNLQAGYFSGRGLSLAEGLTDANLAEVELKKELIAAVRRVNVIIDASKLGKVAFASCAEVSQVQCVITDSAAPAEIVSALRERGIDVILA